MRPVTFTGVSRHLAASGQVKKGEVYSLGFMEFVWELGSVVWGLKLEASQSRLEGLGFPRKVVHANVAYCPQISSTFSNRPFLSADKPSGLGSEVLRLGVWGVQCA